MRLSDISFELPEELIAQSPALPRDSARLLVYDRASDRITHSSVSEIGNFLPSGCLLVANNSKVRKARLYAVTAQGKPVEILVLDAQDTRRYHCLLGGRGLKPGEVLSVTADSERLKPVPLRAAVLELEPHPGMSSYLLEFSSEETAAPEDLFERYGHTPLPPYVAPSDSHDEQYQTVFASQLGSAAAPTAGLHFTSELISGLGRRGIGWEEVTLHVGLGTFLPLREEEIEKNQLHQEETHVSLATAQRINNLKADGGRVVAIGTTSTRTLESHSGTDGVRPGSLTTQMFIYPGYRFQAVSALLTNFHLPQSSLLLLVSAFLGNNADLDLPLLNEEEMLRRLHRVYAAAIAERYRFFSFGDAMLVL